MSVLSVAQSETGSTGGAASGSESEQSTTDQSSPDSSSESSSSGEQVDIAERIDHVVSNFLTGLLPGDYEVKLDWGMLSNISGALSAGFALYVALTKRL